MTGKNGKRETENGKTERRKTEDETLPSHSCLKNATFSEIPSVRRFVLIPTHFAFSLPVPVPVPEHKKSRHLDGFDHERMAGSSGTGRGTGTE